MQKVVEKYGEKPHKQSSTMFVPSWNYNYDKKNNKTTLQATTTTKQPNLTTGEKLANNKTKHSFERPVSWIQKNKTSLEEILGKNKQFVKNFERITHHHLLNGS